MTTLPTYLEGEGGVVWCLGVGEAGGGEEVLHRGERLHHQLFCLHSFIA